MDFVKNMSLKKSFIVILISCLFIGIIGAVGSHMLCQNIYEKLSHKFGSNEDSSFEISLDESGTLISPKIDYDNQSVETHWSLSLVGFLQTFIPVIFVALSVVFADLLYYRIKLKKPLAILKNSAERIIKKDLDFTVKQYSNDELGKLCSSFEVMRKSLLESNRELWLQTEERKRLNTAFSHDLRNPVAVIKNTSKLLQKQNNDSTNELANLLMEYSSRIEKYIDIMSSVQSLEEITFTPKKMLYIDFYVEFETAIKNLDSKKIISVSNLCTGNEAILMDKMLVSHIIENLISNANSFAREKINVSINLQNEYVILNISDDGEGFPDETMKIKPFSKTDDNKDSDYHFGMGLYICDLFAKKHGGNITLSNNNGANIEVSLKIK